MRPFSNGRIFYGDTSIRERENVLILIITTIIANGGNNPVLTTTTAEENKIIYQNKLMFYVKHCFFLE